MNNEHLKDVRKASLDSSKAAVGRLSNPGAQESSSATAPRSSPKAKKGKKNGGRVEPEIRYMTL